MPISADAAGILSAPPRARDETAMAGAVSDVAVVVAKVATLLARSLPK